MKRVMRFLMMTLWVCGAITVFAQNKVDEERMTRDIEIAENILQTLLKQEFSKRNFFPYDVKATYMPGYGVTFRLPSDIHIPLNIMIEDQPGMAYSARSSSSRSFSINGHGVTVTTSDEECEDCAHEDVGVQVSGSAKASSPKARKRVTSDPDSLRKVYNEKIIAASKTFLADYGDLLSQLSDNERIIISNRGDGTQRYWYGNDVRSQYNMISIETTKGDVVQAKQGKITRDQLLAKMKVVNAESIEELNPDLELLSSIFNRLYRPDLSKTYYAESNVYYERLKDFGVIYYMNVVSSSRDNYGRYNLPTLKLDNLDQEARDKKVTELYPAFEKELKENVLEYGRTLRSLKEGESLIFNARVTQCPKCGIPSTVEVAVKNSVLSDFNTGKLTKEAALGKIEIKKGPNQ